MRFGGNYTSVAPNVILEGTQLTAATDGAAGNFTITVPGGTGASTTAGDFQVATPNATTSGTASQSRSTKFKVKREGQVQFVPRASAPTVNVEDGDTYYDSTLNKLRIRSSGAWVDLH